MATPTIQIDPNTGERVGDATPGQTGAVQIDPNTGERVTAAPSATSATPTPTGNRLQNWFDSENAPAPDDSTTSTFLKHGFGAVEAPFIHPVDFAKGVAKMPLSLPAIYPTDFGKVGGVGFTPDTNPAMAQATQSAAAADTDPKRFLAASAGDIGGGLVLGKMGDVVAGPRSLPSLTTPEEAAADQFTKAVKPPKADAPAFAHDVERHFGDLTDYADRTNNPLKVSKDYVKAANGAGDEALAHYKQQILEPVGYRTQPVPPEYQGTMSESAPGTASLRDINSRVGNINAEEKLLRGSSGDLAARQRLLGLGAEKAKLLDILHQSLSDLSGKNADGSPAITPEQVQALRQKGPSLKDIGDTINSTDYSRLVAPGMDTVAGSKLGIGAQILNKLRGGPQAVADRAMGKVAKSAPMEATPLPVPGSTPTSLPPLNTEYLHLNNLEQTAQDSASTRAQQFAETSAKNKTDAAAAEAAKNKAHGDAMRAQAKINAQRVGLPPLQ